MVYFQFKQSHNNQEVQMYYIVETNYVGPNPKQHLNDDTVAITTEPPRGNSGNYPVITDGWCGTTNDWAVYAHGEFDTIEEARDEISETWGDDVAELDQNGHDDPNIVELYRIGKYESMDSDSSIEWCWECRRDVTKNTTDEEIEKIVEECESYVNDEGGTLDTDSVTKMLTEYRDELKYGG